jgi:hypothetical protein
VHIFFKLENFYLHFFHPSYMLICSRYLLKKIVKAKGHITPFCLVCGLV